MRFVVRPRPVRVIDDCPDNCSALVCALEACGAASCGAYDPCGADSPCDTLGSDCPALGSDCPALGSDCPALAASPCDTLGPDCPALAGSPCDDLACYEQGCTCDGEYDPSSFCPYEQSTGALVRGAPIQGSGADKHARQIRATSTFAPPKACGSQACVIDVCPADACASDVCFVNFSPE